MHDNFTFTFFAFKSCIFSGHRMAVMGAWQVGFSDLLLTVHRSQDDRYKARRCCFTSNHSPWKPCFEMAFVTRKFGAFVLIILVALATAQEEEDEEGTERQQLISFDPPTTPNARAWVCMTQLSDLCNRLSMLCRVSSGDLWQLLPFRVPADGARMQDL